jgi:hypothetical protein
VIAESEPRANIFGIWTLDGHAVLVRQEQEPPFAVVTSGKETEPVVQIFGSYDDAKSYLNAIAREELAENENLGRKVRLEPKGKDCYHLIQEDGTVTEFSIAAAAWDNRTSGARTKIKLEPGAQYEMSVDTPAGNLVVSSLVDKNAPGFALELEPKGIQGRVDLALVEVKKSAEYLSDDDLETDVDLYLWANESAGAEVLVDRSDDPETWSHKVKFRNEAIRESLN